MKAGTKLKSAVDETEVMVVKAADAVVSCGGAPMADSRPDALVAIDPSFAEGTRMGKRYVDQAGTIELLCVKAGKASLSVDGVILQTKDAKPLPSSD